MTTALDHAVHTHLAHPAMGCDDAYTEALCSAFAPQPDLPDDTAPGSTPEPMWPELQAPGRWALIYGAAIVAALGLSHACAAGWL